MEKEESCGPLCQHPSCWQSHQRCAKGIYQEVPRIPSPASSDEGLPTQKVVNLLDDYGDDPCDKYPSKYRGLENHQRSISLSAAYGRTSTRRSFPRAKTPNATPASMINSSSVKIHDVELTTLPQDHRSRKPTNKNMSNVEVQEVYDLADLRSDWHETFLAKQFLVWVPNPKHKKKPKLPLEPLKSFSTKQTSNHGNASSKIAPKDMTEDMVPKDMEFHREPTKVSDESSLPSAKTRPPPRSPRSPQQGQPNPRSSRSRGHRDDGPGDMSDTDRLADAMVRAIPKLERESTSLSLANSEVLTQSKKPLLDNTMKQVRMLESIPAKQMFLMEEDSMERQGGLVHPTPATTVDDSVLMDAEYHPAVFQQKVLPSIQGHDAVGKTKVTSISLGLPQIPSGQRATKPFVYKRKDLDFSLGPMLSPPPLEMELESLLQSERGSTLHVTMPTVATEIGTDLLGSSAMANRQRDVSPEAMRGLSSSDLSTRVPLPPNVTPAALSHSGQPQWRYDPPSPSQPPRDPHASPLGPRMPSNATGGISELTGGLGTIHESDLDGDAAERPGTGPHAVRRPLYGDTLPRSRRNVRFAPEIPPQPPSTPDAAMNVASAAGTTPGFRNDASVIYEGSTTINSTDTNLVVVGRGKSEVLPSAGGGRGGKLSLPASRGLSYMSSSGLTPEPWPLVNEDSYNRTPSPQPQTAETTLSSMLGTDQSLIGQFDGKSSQSGLTSQLPPSRESSFQSKSMFKDRLGESPAPPPPSPEGKDEFTSRSERSNANTTGDEGVTSSRRQSNDYGEILDTDSEMTITAKPPSNLDDASRIHTPTATPRTSLTAELEAAELGKGQPVQDASSAIASISGETPKEDKSSAVKPDVVAMPTGDEVKETAASEPPPSELIGDEQSPRSGIQTKEGEVHNKATEEAIENEANNVSVDKNPIDLTKPSEPIATDNVSVAKEVSSPGVQVSNGVEDATLDTAATATEHSIAEEDSNGDVGKDSIMESASDEVNKSSEVAVGNDIPTSAADDTNSAERVVDEAGSDGDAIAECAPDTDSHKDAAAAAEFKDETAIEVTNVIPHREVDGKALETNAVVGKGVDEEDDAGIKVDRETEDRNPVEADEGEMKENVAVAKGDQDAPADMSAAAADDDDEVAVHHDEASERETHDQAIVPHDDAGGENALVATEDEGAQPDPVAMEDVPKGECDEKSAAVPAKGADAPVALVAKEQLVVEDCPTADTLDQDIAQLDQFDATENSFKEELQEEYEKLSRGNSAV